MTNPTTDYFWVDNKIVEYVYSHNTPIPEELYGYFCLDISVSKEYPFSRYGIYSKETKKWLHVPKEDFPPEFMIQLMLLGVE